MMPGTKTPLPDYRFMGSHLPANCRMRDPGNGYSLNNLKCRAMRTAVKMRKLNHAFPEYPAGRLLQQLSGREPFSTVLISDIRINFFSDW